MSGYKFVRQAPIGNYFADFLCRTQRLIVEVDGGTHGEVGEELSDAKRQHDLVTLGYKMVRIHNQDIFNNIEGVLDTILAALNNQLDEE